MKVKLGSNVMLKKTGKTRLDFKPSCMNHKKGNVIGQLTPVE